MIFYIYLYRYSLKKQNHYCHKCIKKYLSFFLKQNIFLELEYADALTNIYKYIFLKTIIARKMHTRNIAYQNLFKKKKTHFYLNSLAHIKQKYNFTHLI